MFDPKEAQILSSDGFTFKCYACKKWIPLAFRDKHHWTPQAAGGTDKDIVWLCSNDHTTGHKLAYAMRNPKRKSELEQMLLHYPDDGYREMMFKLAKTVVWEMNLKNEGQKNLDNVRKTIIIDVSQDEHKKIVFAAKDKSLSIKNYVKMCIDKQLEYE